MNLNGVRILLAEDNPTNQLVAGQMLESLGATVALARDGAEALEIARRESFDVMLIDIEMPRVSGIDVIREIRRSSSPRSETPIIALTAYVMREHRVAIEAAGADGIIAKPIASIERFGADIQGCMSRRTSAEGREGNTKRSDPTQTVASIDWAIYDSLAETLGPIATAELLEKVEADVVSARIRLASALENRAADGIRAATHVLVSVAGTIGATQVQEAAKRVNAAAQPGDDLTPQAEVEHLFEEIDLMLAFLRRERVK